MKHKITEVQIIPIKPNSGLIAFVSLVLNGNLFLGSIGLHSKLDGSGYRLTYPTKAIGDKGINIYHPINKKLSKEIEEAVFSKYSEIINKI